MPPSDASKCHKADKQEAFTELCICSWRDMLRDHSTPDSWLPSPAECVFIGIYQKATPPMTPNSPLQWKGPNKTPPLCRQQWVTGFWTPLRCSSCTLSFLSNKFYMHADFVILWVSLQAHWPILWLVNARTYDTTLRESILMKTKVGGGSWKQGAITAHILRHLTTLFNRVQPQKIHGWGKTEELKGSQSQYWGPHLSACGKFP
jgi:hypothetical protein